MSQLSRNDGNPQLQQGLGFGAALSIVVGRIIGSGISVPQDLYLSPFAASI